jgi:exopolysaccharide biosynthesis protein
MRWKVSLIIIPLFLLAPFIGLASSLIGFEHRAQALSLPIQDINKGADSLEESLFALRQNATIMSEIAAEQEREYQEQQKILQELASRSQEHKQNSDQIYEERILAMLGPPVESYRSGRVEIKVFKLDELGYRGYIAKVKLFDPNAVKVVLGKDTLGQTETTSSAVARTGAILGINGGGFYSSVQGGRTRIMPIGNTVIDGKLVNHDFSPSNGEVFFAGIDRNGKMIGGKFYDKESLMSLQPLQGVSFLPVLIKDGLPLAVPKEWATTKQPRTIIGEYANGDFIMIVVDGRQSDWSSGVTLERLQIKLAELGVKEGYNLDGGGSSTFVFQGRTLNRPSDGKQRPVSTNIVILP